MSLVLGGSSSRRRKKGIALRLRGFSSYSRLSDAEPPDLTFPSGARVKALLAHQANSEGNSGNETAREGTRSHWAARIAVAIVKKLKVLTCIWYIWDVVDVRVLIGRACFQIDDFIILVIDCVMYVVNTTLKHLFRLSEEIESRQ